MYFNLQYLHKYIKHTLIVSLTYNIFYNSFELKPIKKIKSKYIYDPNNGF